MAVYYNEIDGGAAAWLRELMAHGLIPQGEVDERSIADVAADDLRGFHQAHFFAGIGGWAYALMLAGWGDRPVWTGSCPCQPFSQAGKRKGVEDERHLWPEFARLIAECRPPTILGEQVASPPGREWLAGVRADLEALGYAVGAADLCAASVGAPHIRQRLFWVADAANSYGRPGERGPQAGTGQDEIGRRGFGVGGDDGWLADANDAGQRPGSGPVRAQGGDDAGGSGEVGGVGHAGRLGVPGDGGATHQPQSQSEGERGIHGTFGHQSWTPGADVWRSSRGNWVPCGDGKWRRIEPGLEPLVDGLPGRVGLLRGYGNAIVPQVAAAFIKAVM